MKRKPRKTLDERLMEPVGLTYDLQYEIRRAMFYLRRAEKRIKAAHRAEKRARKESAEWRESQRIRDEANDRAAAAARADEKEHRP